MRSFTSLAVQLLWRTFGPQVMAMMMLLPMEPRLLRLEVPELELEPEPGRAPALALALALAAAPVVEPVHGAKLATSLANSHATQHCRQLGH